MCRRKLIGLALFTLALVALLSAGPAFAGQEPAAPAPAPVAQGCEPSLDLGALNGEGATCPAVQVPQASQDMTPDFMVKASRTCRCSCGFPCQTDADCGGGVGSCRSGITCC